MIFTLEEQRKCPLFCNLGSAAKRPQLGRNCRIQNGRTLANMGLNRNRPNYLYILADSHRIAASPILSHLSQNRTLEAKIQFT